MNTSFNNELQQFQMELRAQNFDIIRFSTYRTACKLRFIQKKLNFHLLDLLNVIESLRECVTWPSSEPSSNSLTPTNRRTPTPIQSSPTGSNEQALSINRLTTFLTSIYTNLNKRLPSAQQIAHIDTCVHSALAWFLLVYNNNDSSGSFSFRINSIRVVLVLLCTGKLVDKMRHLFTSYLSSSSSTLTLGQIDDLLHEILAIPCALQETPSFSYRSNLAQTLFSQSTSSLINLNEFLNMLVLNETTPSCLQWLIIFHRLISVENVIHRIKCSACQRPSFSGFRYKCQQCHDRNYQLCQDCFWRGRVSDEHLPTHEMKEYMFFTSPVKEFRQSIRRSFQCMPKNEERRANVIPSSGTNIVTSSSTSPRFFSWKGRHSSTKRHHQHPSTSMSSPSSTQPSSPLAFDRDDAHHHHQQQQQQRQQVPSSSSPHLIRLSTPLLTPKFATIPPHSSPTPTDEHRTIFTTTKSKRDLREEINTDQIDTDEHVQIASYAKQLAMLVQKQQKNPTGIQPPIRFPSCPMNLQMNHQQFHRMVNPPAPTVPISSIRSIQMDHQGVEKRLIISKLEAKNRRILREINTLRAQLKRRNSLDYAGPNISSDLHAYSDTDAYSSGIYSPSGGLSSSMNMLEQRHTQTLPHHRSSPRHESPSYHYYQQQQRNRTHQLKRAGSTETNPYLEHELHSLLSRKHELESRIDHLQQSREELTTQLDTLGKLLRQSPHPQQRSVTASPRGRLSVSPSRMVYHTNSNANPRRANSAVSFRSYSTPPTPINDQLTADGNMPDSTSISQHTKSLRTDLLIAADSLTSAMSSLVQQLNTESTESLTTAVETLLSNDENNQQQTNGYSHQFDSKIENGKPVEEHHVTHHPKLSVSNSNDIIGNDSGSRTDEESLLTSDDDDERQERTTDDDLLRTTDDDDGGGGAAAQTITFPISSSSKRKAPLASEQQQ